MTDHMFRGDEFRHPGKRSVFDPIVAGKALGFSAKLSLEIWAQVCQTSRGRDGQLDDALAQKRFAELANRVVARGGQLIPDPGRSTLVEAEPAGHIRGGVLDEPVPGRMTEVEVNERRWERRIPRIDAMTVEAGQPRKDEVRSLLEQLSAGASAADWIEDPQRTVALSPTAATAAQSLRAEAPRAIADVIVRAGSVDTWLGAPRSTLQTLFGHASTRARAPLLVFDEYRARGLQDLLQRLGPAHPLRPEVLAAATNADRPIAGTATRSREHQPVATTPNGHAMWRVAERHAATLYRRAVNSGAVDPDDPAVESALQQRGAGQPLPLEIRRTMERELGVSLASVRVHTDVVAAQAARALEAEAFTVGEDVFFADGMFAPETRDGRKLLAHELTHVAQALRGTTAPAHDKPRVSQRGEQSEHEADVVAERIDEVATASPRTSTSNSSRASQKPSAAGAMQDQRNTDDEGRTVHSAAQHGTEGSATALPHADQIQRSFGRYDISRVQAFVGGAAREAGEMMGAKAYAVGEKVAFRDEPDLHTAAHEVAHVVQQRGGIMLAQGVGARGDAFERHADLVADAVVQGRSAESQLDTLVDGGGNDAVVGVQRKEDTEQASAPQNVGNSGWAGNLARAWDAQYRETSRILEAWVGDEPHPLKTGLATTLQSMMDLGATLVDVLKLGEGAGGGGWGWAEDALRLAAVLPALGRLRSVGSVLRGLALRPSGNLGALIERNGLVSELRRLVYDKVGSSWARARYWRASAGAGAQGRDLHHWFFPDRWKWVPNALRQAGLNLMELPAPLNRWMGRGPWREVKEGIFRIGVGVVAWAEERAAAAATKRVVESHRRDTEPGRGKDSQ